jgi:hypothetical protein
LLNAGFLQQTRTRGCRGSGRQHIVHQHDGGWHIASQEPFQSIDICHICAPFIGVQARLRAAGPAAAQRTPDRTTQRAREQICLVETASQ